MKIFDDEGIGKISHHIESLSKDMHEIKKSILKKEVGQKRLLKKEKKRKESLKKAQKKFRNVSTNLSLELYEKFEKMIKEKNMTKSEYIQKMILDNIKEYEKEQSKKTLSSS